MNIPDFAERLLDWFARHGRHDLPWQHPRDPYRVWLSEIMLQQTQVAVVIPYFERFVAALPDVRALAAAPLDRVLALWSGLGYYSRARHLHAAAQRCMVAFDGALPTTLEGWMSLPGVGRSTAGAILAQAHGQRQPILDGNVKRVFARLHGVAGWPGRPAVERTLWDIATAALPQQRLPDYTQALMDVGATVCTRHRPACADCPFTADCVAHRERRIAELPTPKPARPLPERTARVLLVHDATGAVWLQRRQHDGVWKGLWSLPQFEHAADADAWLQRTFGRTLADTTALPSLRHGFSHYRLTLHPHALAGLPTRPAPAGGDTAWVPREALAAFGIPAPIRTLLAHHLEAP